MLNKIVLPKQEGERSFTPTKERGGGGKCFSQPEGGGAQKVGVV